MSVFAVGVLALFTLFGFIEVKQIVAGDTTWALLAFMPLILLLWAAMVLEVRSRPYSLHLIHLVALYIFLGVAPLYQCAVGFFPIPQFARTEPGLVLRTNLAVLLWTIVYLIAYAAASRIERKGFAGRYLERAIPTQRIDLLYFMILPCIAYLVAMGMGGVVTRSGAYEAISSEFETGTWIVIQARLVRSFPFVALGTALLSLRKRPRLIPIAVLPIMLIAILYGDNPMASARWWSISLLLGLLGPIALRNRKTAVVTLIGMSFGIGVLPGLGAARRAVTGQEVIENVTQITSPVVYLSLSGDVSSYGMLTLVWRWVEQNGYAGGDQLLSAMLFFVPRVFWPGKSIGTGQMLATDLGFDFTNRAAPIVADPLIDFSWIGVAVVAALFALVLARLDRIYHTPSRTPVRLIDTFYPFLLGAVLFMTRGDLMTGISAVFGFLAAASPYAILLRRGRATAADPQRTFVTDTKPGVAGST